MISATTSNPAMPYFLGVFLTISCSSTICMLLSQTCTLSLICTCASKDGKGLQWRGFKWRIDGQWLRSQITRYTCFALHDFLLLFLVTVGNKKCYKTLLIRKQNTDGMLNVKHLGMVIDSGLKSYFVPSQFSWESGKGTAGNAAQVPGVNFASYQKRNLCWEVARSVMGGNTKGQCIVLLSSYLLRPWLREPSVQYSLVKLIANDLKTCTDTSKRRKMRLLFAIWILKMKRYSRLKAQMVPNRKLLKTSHWEILLSCIIF